jgi:hypothetical protein
VSVPAGDYDWIRLLLNVGSDGAVAGSYIEISGAQYPLIVPSGAQTGLKLVQGFTMTANQVANFTIDFVLQQAITAPPGQQIGGVQAYLLRPALRLIDNVQAGGITGTVALSTLQGHTASCLDSSGNPTTAHLYIFSGAGATMTDVQIDPTTGLPRRARQQRGHATRHLFVLIAAVRLYAAVPSGRDVHARGGMWRGRSRHRGYTGVRAGRRCHGNRDGESNDHGQF